MNNFIIKENDMKKYRKKNYVKIMRQSEPIIYSYSTMLNYLLQLK